jgi:cytochrome P450
VQYVARSAAEPHEFAGVHVEVGETLNPVLAAANRDPAVFHDPDRLDVSRPNARSHLSFGYGGRFCLGNALARMEGTIVLGELTRRFPRMELAADELRYTGSPNLRRLEALPVALNTG